MSLIISRLILTIILTYVFFLVWTKDVDLISFGKEKVENLLPINKGNTHHLQFLWI
jgi:hypothetical protein